MDSSWPGCRLGGRGRALFDGTAVARSPSQRTHLDKDVLSYETTEMADLVADLYGTLAASVGDELPTVTSFLGHAGAWGSWSGSLPEHRSCVQRSRAGVRDTETAVRRRTGENRLSEFEGIAGAAGTRRSCSTRRRPRRRWSSRPRSHDDRHRRDLRLARADHDCPSPTRSPAQFDFHQILGAMNSYPTLLRRLGVVVDLVLSLDHVHAGADEPLRRRSSFARRALTVTRLPDVSAEHARGALRDRVLRGVRRVARRRRGACRRRPARARSVALRAAASRRRWRWTQDHELRALARPHVPGTSSASTPVSRKERRVGAPSLRTAGLMLVQRDRGQRSRTRSPNAKTNDTGAGPDPRPATGLAAGALCRGSRPRLPLRHLGRSDGALALALPTDRHYNIGGRRSWWTAAGEEESIGPARGDEVAGQDDQPGPALAARGDRLVDGLEPRRAAAGRAIKPNDKVGDRGADGSRPAARPAVSARASRGPGSLPRLRYGRRYWLRASAVDLAGNSLLPRDEDFGPEDPERNARAVLRYEPVAAPVVALVRAGGVTERPAEGESMFRMAIRTYQRHAGRQHGADDASARAASRCRSRSASARPSSTGCSTETEGQLGRSTCSPTKRTGAEDPAAALVQESIPTSGPLEQAPAEKTTFAVYKDGEVLTYLPDPLAEEVAIRISGLPGVDPAEVMTIPLYPSGGWPEAQPFKVELVEGPGDLPAFEGATRTLRVPLEKGERALLRLSVKLSRRALRELMGVWRWVASPTAELERLALEGQHWMLTPWRDARARACRATARCCDPNFDPLVVPRSTEKRPPASVPGRPSIKSTDRIDLLAEWHEPWTTPGSGMQGPAPSDTAFSVKITYRTSTRLRSSENPESRRITASRGSTRSTSARECGCLEDARVPRHPLSAHRVLARGDHPLPRVPAGELWTTRTASTDEQIKVLGGRRVTWIPSSAPPPAPEVLYVVPTFGWLRSNGEEGTPRAGAAGGGLRVYLDRPWNVSGYGEMLAVVLAPPTFPGDPGVRSRGTPY